MLIISLLHEKLLYKELSDELIKASDFLDVTFVLLLFSFIPLVNTLAIISLIKAQFICMVQSFLD